MLFDLSLYLSKLNMKTTFHKKKFLGSIPAENVAPQIKRIFKSALQI